MNLQNNCMVINKAFFSRITVCYSPLTFLLQLHFHRLGRLLCQLGLLFLPFPLDGSPAGLGVFVENIPKQFQQGFVGLGIDVRHCFEVSDNLVYP